jgi:alcohol dehydrogenase
MKAQIFQGLGKKAPEERPKPTIVEPTDAIVTICGTDLLILKGDVPHAGQVAGSVTRA